MRSFPVFFCVLALAAATALAIPWAPKPAKPKDCNHKHAPDRSRHSTGGDYSQGGGYHSDRGEDYDDSLDYYDYSNDGGNYNGGHPGRMSGESDAYEAGRYDHISGSDAYDHQSWHDTARHKELGNGGGDYESGRFGYTGAGDHKKDKDDAWRVEGGYYEGGYGTVPNLHNLPSGADAPKAAASPAALPVPNSPAPQQGPLQPLAPPPQVPAASSSTTTSSNVNPLLPKSNIPPAGGASLPTPPAASSEADIVNVAGNVGNAIRGAKGLFDASVVANGLV